MAFQDFLEDKFKAENNIKDYIDPLALAERWSTSRNYLANMRNQDRGPKFCKVGRKVLYLIKDVESYESSKVPVRGK